MIKVKIRKQDEKITDIIITGHADYDVCGKDIVCSAVSSIVTTTINALLKLEKDCINYKGSLEITILKHNKTIDILIENMLDMLKELEQDYKKNIKVEI